jgi:hypothetical protein
MWSDPKPSRIFEIGSEAIPFEKSRFRSVSFEPLAMELYLEGHIDRNTRRISIAHAGHSVHLRGRGDSIDAVFRAARVGHEREV